MSNPRTQNLRDFTVQIRVAGSEKIVGTGIAVSMDGKIVTCAHVIEEAIGVHPREANGEEVGVYFPQARGGEAKDRRAQVAAWFPQHADDVVLLQLIGAPAPLAPEQVPTLGKAEGSEGHAFRSYGYASLGPYFAKYVEGTIMGPVERWLPEATQLHAEMIELRTRDILPGISGSAVLDTDDAKNLVVGLISERWLHEEADNVGWAVNARVLSLEPLGLALQDEPLPKGAAPQPKTDLERAKQQVAPELGIVWNNAPGVLAEWVGREELLQNLTDDWLNPTCRVVGLIGFGGEGKSSLARQWVADVLTPVVERSESPGVLSGQTPVVERSESPGVLSGQTPVIERSE